MRQSHAKRQELLEQQKQVAAAAVEAQLAAEQAAVAVEQARQQLLASEPDAAAALRASEDAAVAFHKATAAAEDAAERCQNRTKLPRVVYLPDCKSLVEAGVEYMRQAIMLSYADDGDVLLELAKMEPSSEALSSFLTSRVSDQFTYIIDQHNELDRASDERPRAVALSPSPGLPDQMDAARLFWTAHFAAQMLSHIVIKGASPTPPTLSSRTRKITSEGSPSTCTRDSHRSVNAHRPARAMLLS